MVGCGFGVAGARGTCAFVLAGFISCWASRAAAQSTASFPDSGGSKPAQPAPVPAPAAPRAANVTPAPSAVPQPAPSALAAVVNRAPETSTDRRFPAAAAPALPAPTPPAYSLAPALLPYRPGLPVPPGYKLEHRSANGLIIGGLASLVVGYATAIVVGGGDDFKNGTGWVVVPVIGPWAAIGARSYHCDNSALDVLQAQKAANECVRGAFNEVQTIAILSADAVVQATGAVLFLAGLASGEDQLVRKDLASVRVTPRALGRDGFGLGFDGRF